MRLYLDTNVFINHFTERLPCSFFLRGLGKQWTIVLSNHTLIELSKQNFLQKTSQLLKWYKTEIVLVTHNDRDDARKYKTHVADALHIVLAIRSDCNYIITRNKIDFIESPIPIRGPNEKL